MTLIERAKKQRQDIYNAIDNIERLNRTKTAVSRPDGLQARMDGNNNHLLCAVCTPATMDTLRLLINADIAKAIEAEEMALTKLLEGDNNETYRV